MGIIELLFIAVGLSMDAFAVSVCKGLNMTKLRIKNALVIGFFFGGFQALMPLIGWFLGSRFESYIISIDHWIAFGLLAFIGGQMVWEALKGEEHKLENADELRFKQLFMLAVGITFALLDGVSIWVSILLIGCTTFAISVAGVFIGFKFGSKYEKGAQIIGGIILIGLGIKILLEHLGILVL